MELFDICTQLAAAEPSVGGMRQLHELLTLTAAKGCSGLGRTFGNLFSQIDFLCKRFGFRAGDTHDLQTARRHSNGTETVGKDDWGYDLRAVSLLISAVYHEDVPNALRCLLPATSRPHPVGTGATPALKYVRCVVRSFDQTTIMADTEDGEILVDYGNTELGRDFGYLRKILREGMQLNLLDCHHPSSTFHHQPSTTDHPPSTLLPGIIIVEPDFLIDISSLSACFTSYGHHPLLYTLRRLLPRDNTQSMLLGNFAGIMLDQVINSRTADSSRRPRTEALYATSLKRAFRKDALRYLACEDFMPDRFKVDARQQMANIMEAVDAMSEQLQGGSPLLEPSFVCERLGLQGRVDLMTADMKLLVEQKSGKNMKIDHQSHDSHGLQREDHYVQLLLYYGILRYNFDKSDSQVDTRLLYSRYPARQGLLSVNYYRTLLREALRLRNQIVATELLIAREGFGRILPLLTIDTIYKDVARDGHFHRYYEPPLSNLNFQLSTLSPLERAYLERMMTFVYREQVCQKLGSCETTLHHSSGSGADLWQMPISEKLETGNIYMGLTITGLEKSDPDGGYDVITLDIGDDNAWESRGTSNFRRGDMVCLYSYRQEPDVRKSILYKGTLQAMEAHRLVVCLNDGQQDAAAFDRQQAWAVEHAGSDASTTGNIKGLMQFAVAPKHRKDLLLGQRPPVADTSLTLSQSYNPHYDDILLKVRQARDYFLLVGPPGTGKTSMALRFMVTEELHHPPSTILLMAYTNRAVDEICAMLTDAGMDFLRLGNAASCDPRFSDRLLETLAERHPSYADLQKRISQSPVIVSTTSMMLARPHLFQLKHFSLTIVDEASQILEPGLIGLLASPLIDRFVLIGDHKQLPAVVQLSAADAAVSEACLQQIGLTDCRQSLFQRLYEWELSQGRTQFVGLLDHQGRMHPQVAAFPSQLFYEGRLLPVPCDHQKETALNYTVPSEDPLDDLLKSHRVLFLPVGPAPTLPHSPQSNEAEAVLVADLLRRIHRFYGERFDAAKTVGVIVPYRNQISAIRRQTERLGIPALDEVSIDTVERYQGSQRDVIIYSFTVSRRYQLDFLTSSTFIENGRPIDRKLNVALTRARHQTLMVGNPDVLSHAPLFGQLIDTYMQRQQ